MMHKTSIRSLRCLGLLFVAIVFSAFSTVLPVGAAQATNLNFVVWSYGIETIQSNIQNFQKLNPDITVKLQDYSWLQYHDTMVGRFTANNAPEVLYGSDHWLQEWANAGWLEPLDTHFPQVKEYSNDLAPYALQGMTYDGHIYGLSYYADTIVFVYNEEHLTKAGITKPPETWDDVLSQAQTIKDKGIAEYPIILAFSQQEGASIEAFYSMVYSRFDGPGAMFDEKNTPTFNKEGSAAAQTIDWLKSAYDKKLLDPASLQTAEIDQVKSMQAGAHTFTIFPQYNLAELNKPASSDFAGKFKMALMPGSSHATVGYVRFYAMSSAAVKGGQPTLDAAWKFLEYFGGKTNGKYEVVKRWAVENGLGFAQLPLFDDPDVAKAFGAWGDIPTIKAQAKLARIKEGLTPWYGSWDVFTRAEVQKAILGQESTADALKAMADKFTELSTQ
jgi:multiple sugar transport system substrate-binding protein